ncbi:MAG: DUF5362 family protein [Candidatus Bathyarchaeota archaeon]|jgi:membrane-bound ClpP family serine protease|nr:DUF5362 family protein [Candidatus Bathyarchaeota archaeon]
MRKKMFIWGVILILLGVILVVSLIGMILGVPILIIGGIMFWASIFVPEDKKESTPASST